MECWWYITGPTDEHIQLTWTDMILPYATLKIYDLLLNANFSYYDSFVFMSLEEPTKFEVELSPMLSSNKGLVVHYSYDNSYSSNPISRVLAADIISIRRKHFNSIPSVYASMFLK